MANYNSNLEIAQEISARIGTSPIPFDSVYSIAQAIYEELGGDESLFDSVYSILLGILPLVTSGAGADIQVVDSLPDASTRSANIYRLSSDAKVYVAVVEDDAWTWKEIPADLSDYATIAYVDEQIATVTNTENADLEEKSTIDFTFVDELPVSGEEDLYVIINGENQDTLYKYVSGAWAEQTPDANSLYFDTEGAQLYSYVTAEQQFAPVSTVNTIIVSGSLNSNAALKAIKTAGNYNVLQHLSNATRGSYLKNWAMTVQAVDYDEYDTGDNVYQKLENNVTIYKRTWSGSRSTNDGWTVFSTYYEGLVKDTATSKYYTWSSNKLSGLFADIKSVTDVETLPDAELNKDKLVRYEGKVYYVKPEEFKAVKFTALEDGSSVGLAHLSTNQILESSLDGIDWITFDTTTSISLNSNESVYIRGILSGENTNSNYTQFALGGKIAASGNINTLWDYTAEDLGEGFQLKNYCGYALFSNCISLTRVDNLYLPSMQLAEYCYYSMFQNVGFDSDTQIEMLPATTLTVGCYEYMFLANNRSAKMPRIAPILPATTLKDYSYYGMFSGARISENDMTNYIKCLATSGFDASYPVSNFVRGRATGTFVKATAANGWTIGNGGIPEGWEIVNDDTIPEYNWHNVIVYNWVEIPEALTAGDNITISGNTISANSIEEVNELPEASENQDKLVRLNSGDKKVYASKLESSVTVTTDRLPDDEQIDKAYLYEDSENFYYYKGAYKLVLSDGEVNGYGWLEDLGGGEWYFYLTEDNAENITQNSIAYYLVDGTGSATIDETNKIVTNPGYSINDKDTLQYYEETPIVATYNAPEANQIGNATIEYDGYIWTYTGEAGTADDTETTYNGYKWENNENNYIVSTKKASEIFYVISSGLYIGDFVLVEHNGHSVVQLDRGNTDSLYIPQLNAPDSEQVGVATITWNASVSSWVDTYYYIGTLTALDYSTAEPLTLHAFQRSSDNRICGIQTAPSALYTQDYSSIHVWNYNNTDFNPAKWEGEDTGEASDYSTVKYQRSETTETWGWGEVINENIINDSSASATSVYSSSKVDELLEDKANQVDYIVPLTVDTETYEYVPDYSVLNSATTDGSYTLKYVFTESNVDTTVAYGNLQVSQGGMLQIIYYFNGIFTLTMRMNESDQWMIIQENIIPSIWQSNIAKDISSYSAAKVDELIASLEARIAALEGA